MQHHLLQTQNHCGAHLAAPPAPPPFPPSPRSAKFEQLVKSLLDRTVQPCHNCMKDAGVQPADIQEVLMVGGMTRMPKVREGAGAQGAGMKGKPGGCTPWGGA